MIPLPTSHHTGPPVHSAPWSKPHTRSVSPSLGGKKKKMKPTTSGNSYSSSGGVFQILFISANSTLLFSQQLVLLLPPFICLGSKGFSRTAMCYYRRTHTEGGWADTHTHSSRSLAQFHRKPDANQNCDRGTLQQVSAVGTWTSAIASLMDCVYRVAQVLLKITSVTPTSSLHE